MVIFLRKKIELFAPCIPPLEAGNIYIPFFGRNFFFIFYHLSDEFETETKTVPTKNGKEKPQ